MKDFSYALGLVIGHNLKGSGISAIDASEFATAVKDVLENAQTRIDSRKAQQIVNERLTAMQEEAGRAARETGEAFLADNAKKEGVVTTESGLQYMVLTEGSGKHPAATDRVKCHYEGRLIDGTVFDSSYLPPQRRYSRLDRRLATYGRGRKVPLLHSLQPCLRRTRRRRKHPALRSPRV